MLIQYDNKIVKLIPDLLLSLGSGQKLTGCFVQNMLSLYLINLLIMTLYLKKKLFNV